MLSSKNSYEISLPMRDWEMDSFEVLEKELRYLVQTRFGGLDLTFSFSEKFSVCPVNPELEQEIRDFLFGEEDDL